MNTLYSESEHNRRSICRIPLQLPVHLFVNNDSGQQYEAKSINLHFRGAEITTDTMLSKGTPVYIGLPEEMTDKCSRATPGEIRWVINTQGKFNYGVSFKEDLRWVPLLNKYTPPTLGTDGTPSIAENVLNSLDDAVFCVDKKWRILLFNLAAEKLTGWKRKEVLGRKCKEIFQVDGCHDCTLAKSIKKGTTIVSHSHCITTTRGKRIPATTTNAIPLKDTDGNIIGGVQIFHHISRKQKRGMVLDTVASKQDIAITIQTLGRFCLSINGHPIYDRFWKGRRSKELLKAIIAFGGTKVSMKKLSCLLWPDSDGDHATNNLKMALSRLRRVGREDFSMPANWLVVKHRRVSLVHSVCRVDALEFSHKLKKISDFKSMKSMQQALALYTDDFLPQDETPWIAPFRDHLRNIFIKGVLHFASLKNRDEEILLAFLEQARHSDPLHEGVYACLMECHINAGSPATALDVFNKAEKNISLKTGVFPGSILQVLALRAKQIGLKR